MDTTTHTGTPLRQRMLEDMRMRKMAEHTQEGYIRAVRKLASFLGRSPDTATVEELRRFQLHLVDSGAGPVTINATISAANKSSSLMAIDCTLSMGKLSQAELQASGGRQPVEH